MKFILKINLINNVWLTIIQRMIYIDVCFLFILISFIFYIIGSQKPVSVTKLCFFCAISHVSSRRKKWVRVHNWGRWKGKVVGAGLFNLFTMVVTGWISNRAILYYPSLNRTVMVQIKERKDFNKLEWATMNKRLSYL